MIERLDLLNIEGHHNQIAIKINELIDVVKEHNKQIQACMQRTIDLEDTALDTKQSTPSIELNKMTTKQEPKITREQIAKAGEVLKLFIADLDNIPASPKKYVQHEIWVDNRFKESMQIALDVLNGTGKQEKCQEICKHNRRGRCMQCEKEDEGKKFNGTGTMGEK